MSSPVLYDVMCDEWVGDIHEYYYSIDLAEPIVVGTDGLHHYVRDVVIK